MVVRYMGTKRHMVASVQQAVSELATAGRAVDLFSGMGSVAESLSECNVPVITNDALEFTACQQLIEDIRNLDSAAAIFEKCEAVARSHYGELF